MIIEQLYFDRQSFQNCSDHPDVHRVKVERNPFFENHIIARGVPDYVDDWFGVFSHQAERKIRMAGNRNFTMDQLFEKVTPDTPADVIGFHHGIKNMLIFTGAERIKLDKCLVDLCNAIDLRPLGVGMRARFPVLQNHFIARPDVFGQYVDEALFPAIMAIEEDRVPMIYQEPNYTAGKKGVKYTYIPFVLEKLFSTWLQSKKSVKCMYFKDL